MAVVKIKKAKPQKSITTSRHVNFHINAQGISRQISAKLKLTLFFGQRGFPWLGFRRFPLWNNLRISCGHHLAVFIIERVSPKILLHKAKFQQLQEK